MRRRARSEAPPQTPSLNIVFEGVFEARFLDRAVDADAPGDFHSYAVARKERFGRIFPTLACGHPAGIQVIDLRYDLPQKRTGLI